MHTDFKFHPQVTQVGCYWGDGGHTELYLIEGDDLALIDTGCTNCPGEYVAPALAALGRELTDIKVILNTHGHFDHAGGNAALYDVAGAEVWLSERDAPVAADLELQFEKYFAQNDTLVGRADRLPASKETLYKQARPSKIDRKLADGEVLDLGRGVELRVLPTPGHTQGSVSFYWEREGLLFSGDALPGRGSRPGGFPLIYTPAAFEQTLDLIGSLDLRALCMSHHYRTLTLSTESVKYGAAIKGHVDECRQIFRAVARGLRAALRERPGAPFLEVGRAATAAVAQNMPVAIDQDTGLPQWGPTAILYALWQLERKAEGAWR
ncbi:MAG: MBL fold metallo-hydrolase [Chloroflexi bacterium]|nr:MBL fold metallo-hydrolase [Chloroflexota bacterium]MCL5107880.1 MBL fold metallo-hydrolase [Chloroflexota bacterium]